LEEYVSPIFRAKEISQARKQLGLFFDLEDGSDRFL
jgi:hypothetical protein